MRLLTNGTDNNKGKNIDESFGEALIGAGVTIQGTTEGVITDFDGKYELETDIALPFTMEVSYLGYVTKSIEISTAGNQPTIKTRGGVG